MRCRIDRSLGLTVIATVVVVVVVVVVEFSFLEVNCG
nr:MAG TPA: hypothetical protein [Caudoviricetes sp.]